MARKSSKILILDTAEALFAQQGISNISLRHINQATGLSPAAVHYHFKNKQGLIAAILLRDGRSVAQRDPLAQALQNGRLALPVENYIAALMQPFSMRFLEDQPSGGYFISIIAQLYPHKSHTLDAFLPPEFEQISKRARSLLIKLLAGQEISSAMLQYRLLSISLIESLATFDAVTPAATSPEALQQQKQFYLQHLQRFLSQALNLKN